MAALRNRSHILVPGAPETERYTPHGRGFETKVAPAIDRIRHGQQLTRALEAAVAESHRRRNEISIEVHGAVPGLYIQLESQPDAPLHLTALEDERQGIELVAFSHTTTDEPTPRRIEHATVFVPDGKIKHFLKRFEAYAKATPRKPRERRYENMLDPVATLRLATLRGLWTDTNETYPEPQETIWWEVWLRRNDGRELERLTTFAAAQHLSLVSRWLQFHDRIVTLVRGTPAQLGASIDVLNDLAEVRKAQETARDFIDMSPADQGEWAKELSERVSAAPAHAPAVCVLDTGVTQGHLLLAPSLSVSDCHTCDRTWNVDDHHGHGTEMAGLALYGDLSSILASTHRVVLRHRLESVKILPPPTRAPNPPELYGAVTAEATSRAEIAAPQRRRTFLMTVMATDERDRGQPTSWSAAVDALSAGRSFDPTTNGLGYLDELSDASQRLFVLSAGNVDPSALTIQHLDRSDLEPIHDPGQAWNALTVGAMTSRAVIHDPAWANWRPLAKLGELSPWSTTGMTFANDWPIKPDVVFEGGNVARNAKDELSFPCPDLSLLTTHFRPTTKAFELSWATSAASAQVARIAATISAEYPTLWPQTVRALVVHSAQWTQAMQAHLQSAHGKRARTKLIQRYGFGVPSLERALRSANNALTLIAQSAIHPFSNGKMSELQFFKLPWPREALLALGSIRVRLRVTLSYFIEPNPGRRGWKDRYRYASHRLQFDVKGPTEGMGEFRKRLNKKALEEDEPRPSTGGDSSEWYLGEQARKRGSLHSDILECNAAELAERGIIAIYPRSGWWKDQPRRDRSHLGARYALVVTIEAPDIETDLWTPVAQQVGLPVAIET